MIHRLWRRDSASRAESSSRLAVQPVGFEGETRNCDLVVVCYKGTIKMVISVEAKADESFGSSDLGHYYDQKQRSVSNVPKCIEHLSLALFGPQRRH